MIGYYGSNNYLSSNVRRRTCMWHRALHASPHTATRPANRQPSTIAILKYRYQVLPRQPNTVTKCGRRHIILVLHHRPNSIQNRREVVRSIVPQLLYLHDVAPPRQEKQNRRQWLADLGLQFRRTRRLRTRPFEMLEDALGYGRIGRAKGDRPPRSSGSSVLQSQTAGGHERVDRRGRQGRRRLDPTPQ